MPDRLAPSEPFRLAFVANVATPYRQQLLDELASSFDAVATTAIYYRERGDFSFERLAASENVREIWLGSPRSRADRFRFWSIPGDWRLGRRIVREIKATRTDAVIVNGYDSLALLYTIGRTYGTGVAVYMRGDSNIANEREKGVVVQAIKRRLLRWVRMHVNGVMAVGSRGVEYYEYYGFPPDSIYVVPYEARYEFFATAQAPEVLIAFSRAHNLDPSRRFVVYSGRLVSQKRVDLLVDAFAAIANQRPDWMLLIAGSGPLDAELRERVPADVRSSISWLGFCDQQAMRSAYQLADVLVLPSDAEPWGLVVNEAMAAGLVPVVSDVVGAGADLVDDGISGHVFRHGDPRLLAEALLLATDEQRLKQAQAHVRAKLRRYRSANSPVASIGRLLELTPRS